MFFPGISLCSFGVLLVYTTHSISRLPEALDLPVEPRLHTSYLPQEMIRFIGRTWEGAPLEEHHLIEFSRFYYKEWLERLNRQKPRIEQTKKAFRDFSLQMDEIDQEVKRLDNKWEHLHSSVEEKRETFKKVMK